MSLFVDVVNSFFLCLCLLSLCSLFVFECVFAVMFVSVVVTC